MTEFGLMSGLSWLSMNDNDMTGPIPTELGNLVNMTRMSFKDCMLTGTIPSELGRMTILENLSLETNLLSGTMPDDICTLRNLELNLLVVDCSGTKKSSKGEEAIGVHCTMGEGGCCTFCRRKEDTIPDFLKDHDKNNDGLVDHGYGDHNDEEEP